MRTTTIQIARILRDTLSPADLARAAEAIEGYLIDNDPEAGGLPNPTLVRRTDVAADLLDRIETHLRDDAEAAHEAEVAEKRAGWSATP